MCDWHADKRGGGSQPSNNLILHSCSIYAPPSHHSRAIPLVVSTLVISIYSDGAGGFLGLVNWMCTCVCGLSWNGGGVDCITPLHLGCLPFGLIAKRGKFLHSCMKLHNAKRDHEQCAYELIFPEGSHWMHLYFSGLFCLIHLILKIPHMVILPLFHSVPKRNPSMPVSKEVWNTTLVVY